MIICHRIRPLRATLGQGVRALGKNAIPHFIGIFHIHFASSLKFGFSQGGKLTHEIIGCHMRHVKPRVAIQRITQSQHCFQRETLTLGITGIFWQRTLAPIRQGRIIGIHPIHKAQYLEGASTIQEIRIKGLLRIGVFIRQWNHADITQVIASFIRISRTQANDNGGPIIAIRVNIHHITPRFGFNQFGAKTIRELTFTLIQHHIATAFKLGEHSPVSRDTGIDRAILWFWQ